LRDGRYGYSGGRGRKRAFQRLAVKQEERTMERQAGWVVNRARPVLAVTALVATMLVVLWLAVSLAGAVPAGPSSLSGSATGVVLSSSERALLLAPTVVFSDDFESDQGWTVNPFGTDDATAGMWERADPEPTDESGDKQLDAHGDVYDGIEYDLVTGALAGISAGEYDIDGGVTSVRSPAIVLPAGAWDELDLSFYYYLAHRNNSSTADYLRVRVAGAETTLLEVLGKGNDVDAAWDSHTASLVDYAGQTIRLLIEAADEADPSLVEAAIDDVMITAVDSTPPTSTATSPAQVTGGSIPVGWTAGDTASGLDQVCLWVRPPGGSWSDSGMCSPNPSGTFAFNPTHGEGTYYFQTVATDNAGNSEAGASHNGDTQTLYVPVQPVYLPLVSRDYSLVTNGGFEDGWAGWAHGGALSQAIVTNDGWSGPHSGSYAARLGNPSYACNGGVPLGTAWVEQTIAVPSRGVSTLQIHYNIYSQDKLSDPKYDRFEIWVEGSLEWMDGILTDPYGCGTAPRTTGWRVFNFDVTGYQGTSITLRLQNVSDFDNWYNTWTYVDDIQLLP
jgi:hypothetical protein